MPRAFLVVMDSVGVGGAPDAGAFFNGAVPDTGANTLAHIAQARAADGQTLRVPNLAQLGLGEAINLASDAPAPGIDGVPTGLFGAATEVSLGKDTPSGHWELAGLPVPWHWHHFPDTYPAFPEPLTRFVAECAGTDGILGNCHASGTDIVARLGQEHVSRGWPICYTSADSVFQVAAHEGEFGLSRLLDLCERIAPRLHDMKVGRVIARPFVGDAGTGFVRTGNRRDYAIAPPGSVLTNWIQNAGHPVFAVGKIGDIFSMEGIDHLYKGDDATLMSHLSGLVDDAPDGALVFANFVEFDSLYGHRRDVHGYAAALERFDFGIGSIRQKLRSGDMLVLTADHGNDPTWVGTDHTRERVPVLVDGLGAGALGHVSFADVAASIAQHLGVASTGPGQSFI